VPFALCTDRKKSMHDPFPRSFFCESCFSCCCVATHAAAGSHNACCAPQVLTQISLILLLFGTIVGDFALISDVSARAFKGLAAPDTPPAWLVAYDGRGTMCLFAVVAVYPLCCLKGMRQVGLAHNHFLLACEHSKPTVRKFLIRPLEM